MTPLRLSGAALLALLAAVPAMAAVPAACPQEPVRVVRSVGGSTDYRGSVPGIPELCVMARPDGDGQFYMGAWRSDWPGAGAAYPALRSVINGGKGAHATFDTFSVPGWQWHDSFVNHGEETLVVDGKPYTTLVLAHEREGFGGNWYHSIITSWRDIGSGITLKVVEHQIAGTSYGPATTWTATKVEPLPASGS